MQLLEQLGHEVWIGDAAQIRASYVRKQKTDTRDAGHILKLLVEDRFPPHLGAGRSHAGSAAVAHSSSQAGTDTNAVKNELQHLMMNQGMQKKHKLWSAQGRAELSGLALQPWANLHR